MDKSWRPIIIFTLCIALIYLIVYDFGPIGAVIAGILKRIFGSLKALIELILIICGIVIAAKVVSRKDKKK